MKKKLLLFTLLLAGLTSAHARGEAGLTVSNIRNAVYGCTASFDVRYSATSYVRDIQFDITLPNELSYLRYAPGDMLNGHTVTASNQGNGTTRFTIHSLDGNTMKTKSGTLLTVYFTVLSQSDPAVLVTNIIHTSDAAQSSTQDEVLFYVPVGNTITLTDNDTNIPGSANNVNVTVSRTLTADKWNTICLPFAMSAEQVVAAFGEDAKLGDFAGYTVSGDNIRVSFTTATAIAANHPYLLKVTSDKYDFTVEGVDIVAPTPATPPMVNFGEDATDEHIKAMVGVYSEQTLPAYRLYIKDNTFKYSNGTTKIRPYRAYFHFCDFNAGNNARSFILDDEFTTSIGEAIRFDGNGTGHSPEGLYDLQGRKVSNSQSSNGHMPTGVYIQDGKKVIKK